VSICLVEKYPRIIFGLIKTRIFRKFGIFGKFANTVGCVKIVH
jgi:hypothetical protein